MKLVNPIVDVRLLRTRWVLTIALALGAGFLVVESYAFAESTAAGISFAVSIAMVVAAAALLMTARRARQYVSIAARELRLAAWEGIAAFVLVVSAWNVVQSLVFDAGTVRWLTFADGLGVVGAALIGLVLHELSTERVVHSLEVVPDEKPSKAEHEPRHAAA